MGVDKRLGSKLDSSAASLFWKHKETGNRR